MHERTPQMVPEGISASKSQVEARERQTQSVFALAENHLSAIIEKIKELVRSKRFAPREIEQGRAAADEARSALFDILKKYSLSNHEFDIQQSINVFLKESRRIREPALAALKERMAKQRIGFARVQQEMTGAIRDNPNASPEFLKAYVDSIAEDASLNTGQLRIAHALIDAYCEKHRAVDAFAHDHPYTDDMYEAAFGRRPLGQIEVVKGPMTLHFRCSDIRDYAYVTSGAYRKKRELTSQNVESALGTSGVFLYSSSIPELEGTLIVERTLNRTSIHPQAVSTHAHEEQHAIDKLFNSERALFAYGLEEKKNEKNKPKRLFARTGDFLNAAEEKEAERLLVRVFRAAREHAETRARNELLAHFAGNRLNYAYESLTKPAGEGGVYDYLAEDMLPESIKEQRPFWKDMIEKTRGRSFSVNGEEYTRVIRSGIDALERLRKAGYSSEEIKALLIWEPLRTWPKFVKRIVEADASFSL